MPKITIDPTTGLHPGTLTDVRGIEVGHHTLTGRSTGCSVVVARGSAVGGVDVRGAR